MILGVVMTDTFERMMGWRKHLNKAFSQVWHVYIHKIMQIILTQTFSNDQLECITKTLLIKMRNSNNFLLYAREVLENTPFSSSVLKASGRIALQMDLKLMGSYRNRYTVSLHYTWLFHTLRSLSLRINVENIQFATGYLGCHWARLRINKFNSLHHSFIYCGHQTNFSIYPSYSDVNITLYTNRDSLFIFSASYTIVTKNQIVSISSSNLNIADILWIYRIDNEFFFYTFHVKVKKIHHAVVLFLKTITYTYRLYDGPGFLSPKLRYSGDMYKTSTFQCIIQIFTKTIWTTIEESFDYISKPVNISTIVKIDLSSNESSFSISLPVNTCFQQHCAIYFFTEEKNHINITLLEIIYKGPTGERCKYGGLVTGEYTVSDDRESLTICQHHGGGEHHGHTFISRNSSQILLVYWYEHYSKISTNVQVSLTKCNVVQFDACRLRTFCILKSCNSYLKTISHNHLSHKKGPRVSFLLDGLECMVIQFRKRVRSLDTLFDPQCDIQLRSGNVLQLGQELQYKLKGSLYSSSYNLRAPGTKSIRDYLAISGNTNNFIPLQTFQIDKFNFSYKVIQKQKNKAALCKREDFFRIVQTDFKNKYIYIWASQSSSSASNLLQIHVGLNFFSQSWLDVVISKHDVEWKFRSTLKDMYLTESITLPFNLYRFKSVGYRWDHFLLLKLDKILTKGKRLIFNVNVKSCFDGFLTRAKLSWSSHFNMSHLRDFKLISLPGRIYEFTIKMNNKLLHQNELLKNNSLSLIWMQERFSDSYVPTRHNTSCNKAREMNFDFERAMSCLNSSLPSPKKMQTCLIAMFPGTFNFKCIKYTLPGESNEDNDTQYMIFPNEVHNMNNTVNSHKVSWIEASEVCKKEGAMLPYFTNRKDLDKLIRLFKLSRGPFLQEGIFIGLIYNPSNKQVNVLDVINHASHHVLVPT